VGSALKKIGQPMKVDLHSNLVATLGISLDEFARDVRAFLELTINSK